MTDRRGSSSGYWGGGLAAAALAALLSAGGCGYRLSGRADLLPQHIQTIAVQGFANSTARYRISDALPAALTREFLSRTRYRVIADASAADAVLQGAMVSYNSYPTIFDPATGRASAVQISATLQLRLTERSTGRVLFDRPAFEAHQRYEISVDEAAYFEESGMALERLSREVARQVVSAILEDF